MSGTRTSFLLLSKEGPSADRMVRHLRTKPQYDVVLESSPKAALTRLSSRPFDCLLLNLDVFGFRQYRLVEQIRSLGYDFRIIILADHVLYAAEEVVEKMHDVIIFGKSYIDVDADLLGICARFARGDKTPKRSSKRKPTRQKALVEVTRTGNSFSCMAHNMSAGGAYIEFHVGNIHMDDIVSIKVYLPRLKKTHVIKAQVMWVKSSPTGTRAAGLKFTK